jgi:hypothetical protein
MDGDGLKLDDYHNPTRAFMENTLHPMLHTPVNINKTSYRRALAPVCQAKLCIIPLAACFYLFVPSISKSLPSISKDLPNRAIDQK